MGGLAWCRAICQRFRQATGLCLVGVHDRRHSVASAQTSHRVAELSRKYRPVHLERACALKLGEGLGRQGQAKGGAMHIL